MLTTDHKLSRLEAEQLKDALRQHLAPVTDPEATARALILAFKVIDEATQEPAAKG
jgi:hypothetical protein